MTWDCVILDLDGTLTRPGATTPAPGVDVVLEALHARGVLLGLATSAPTPVAHRVLADLGHRDLFTSVAGAPPNGAWAGKDTAIAEALLGLGRPLPEGAAGAVMVGDTEGDVRAALAQGVDAVGVGWGQAPADALRAAGAVAVADDPAALLELLAPSAGAAGGAREP